MTEPNDDDSIKRVRETAERLASLQSQMMARARANIPRGPDERIKAAAAGVLLRSALDKAELEYRSAIRDMTPEQLEKIANG